MSKIGNLVIDMREDAVHMELKDFTEKYGVHNLYVWQQVHLLEPEPDPEPYYYPGSDPQE